MDLKQGEILYDVDFIYPDGGDACDKLLLVANKLYIYPADLVLIPSKTHASNYKYKPDCNEIEREFYIEKQIGFYKSGTIVQLKHTDVYMAQWIKEKINKKTIHRLNKFTTPEEFGRILNCLKKIKYDIPQEIQNLIF